jgi:glycosyltransferase involved in cell wall biosynthesis
MPVNLRIARIITRLNIGGPAIQALRLSSRLDKHGFETLLVHGRVDESEGDMRAVLASEPLSSLYVPQLRRPIRPHDDLRAFVTIYRMLCSFKPHIVHTHMAKAGTLGRLAALAYNRTRGRHSAARTVHTYHGHVFDGYFRPGVSSAFVKIEQRLAGATDVIVAISPRIRREILTNYHIGRPDQVRVVPLGFDLHSFAAIDQRTRQIARRELQVPENTLLVTTVGRLVPIKRQDIFLEMASALATRFSNARFLVVGDGPLRVSLERRAADLGIADRIRFLGWRSDLARIYAATDLFVLTSDNEGTPVALIEAMAAGVASISTDVGGVRDVVPDDQNGRVFPAGQPLQLADGAFPLLTDEALRSRVGENGRRAVVERFGFDRLVSDLVALYGEVT